MRLLSIVLAALAGLSAAACAGTASEENAESGEDAFSSGVPVRVDHDFAPVSLELSKELSDVFDERGYGATTKITPTARFSLTRAKLSGMVTPGRANGRPTILSAQLRTFAHYDTSFEVKLDVDGIGNVANLSRDDREDWEEKLIGGKPVVLAQDLVPADIPIGGPLFVHTHIDLTVACAVTELDGHFSAKTGAGFSGDLGFTIDYKRDHFAENDSRFRFSTIPPNFQARHTPLAFTSQPVHAKGRCNLQPSLVVLFERSIGARLFVEPYVDVETSLSRASGLSVDQFYGVEAYAQTDVQILGHRLLRPFEFPLFDRRLDGNQVGFGGGSTR